MPRPAADDPALGRRKRETFITRELAPLLVADETLNYNGHRGIGGLSMGAGAAVRIGNLHPPLFDAAIGISGCCSTPDQLGLQTTKMTVESRGADTTNMWDARVKADVRAQVLMRVLSFPILKTQIDVVVAWRWRVLESGACHFLGAGAGSCAREGFSPTCANLVPSIP